MHVAQPLPPPTTTPSCAGVELMLALFMSLNILPIYALTTAAGSHSAASVIAHCLKHQVKPDLARSASCGWVVGGMVGGVEWGGVRFADLA